MLTRWLLCLACLLALVVPTVQVYETEPALPWRSTQQVQLLLNNLLATWYASDLMCLSRNRSTGISSPSVNTGLHPFNVQPPTCALSQL